MHSNTQLYSAAIASVSGLYSVGIPLMQPEMDASGLLMVLLGIIVLFHGLLLLTNEFPWLQQRSSPLMMGYAIVMLLNQLGLATGIMNGGSGSAMGMAQPDMMPTMGWDAGMVALAVLMLLSGLIMRRTSSMQ